MGNVFLAQPKKEKDSSNGSFKNMTYGVTEMQGWRVNQEDASISKFNIIPDVHIFGVFDGHGGREVSNFCKRHFIDEMLNLPSFKKKDYKKALHETFLRMDDMIISGDYSKELASLKNDSGSDSYGSGQDFQTDAGCTANVVLIDGKRVYCANSGDSRCTIYSQGQNIDLSEDHKPDDQEEKSRIEKAGGFVFQGRINHSLNLSRAIGDFQFKGNSKLRAEEQIVTCVPDIREYTLTGKENFMIIGCDGVFERYTHQEICQFVDDKITKEKNTPVQAIEQFLDYNLADDTMEGVGCDNMTCICLKFN